MAPDEKRKRSQRVPVVGPEGRKLELETWEAKDGYRWALWAANGRQIAESGQGYEGGRSKAKDAAAAVIPNVPVEEIDTPADAA
jgi:uncharacterized protein YegP (UPF0339 family)